MLTASKMLSLTCKCLFHRSEHNAKEDTLDRDPG